MKSTDAFGLQIAHLMSAKCSPFRVQRIDWSHIFPYYDDRIIFGDSVQRVEGIDEFKAMCNRLTNRCEQLNMEIGCTGKGRDLSPVEDDHDFSAGAERAGT